MEVHAYRLPVKGKEDVFYLVEGKEVPLSLLVYGLGRGNYPIFEKILGSYYKYYEGEVGKDEGTTLILLGKKGKSLHLESIKGAISDTIYQTKMIETDVLDALSSFAFAINVGHWWIKYGLSGFILLFTTMAGYTSGTWVDLLLATWLLKGREIAIQKSMEKWTKDYLDKVKIGVRKAFKNISKIEEVEYQALKKLKEIIEKEHDKTEAYIKALHKVGNLGLPELRGFYSFNAPINEWKIEEVGKTFDVFEKAPVEPRFEFKKRIYQSSYERLKDAELELFDYNLKPKFLSKNKTFDDWHKHIKDVAKKIGAEEITVYVTRRGKPVNFYAVGDSKAPFKFLIKGGHEDEFRYLPAIYQMMASFLKEGKLTNRVLSKVRIYFLECDDPDGFDMRAWTAVDMRGREVHWPPEYFSLFTGNTYKPIFNPLFVISSEERKEEIESFAKGLIAKDITKNIFDKGGVIYRDENGVYCDEIRSERILAIQKFIHEKVRPHVAVDLHETVRGTSAHLVYNGAGILEIGHYPIQEKILEKIYELAKQKKPHIGIISYTSIVPKIRKLLKNNLGFNLGKAMMENVKRRGLKTYNGEFQALLEAPSLLPQLIAVDIGRSISGWVYKDAEMGVCQDWLMKNYGTLAYTTETFPNSLWEVVMEDMAYIEGGLKYIIERW